MTTVDFIIALFY
jgi:hypothetical protein